MNLIEQKKYLATKLGVNYANLSQSYLRADIELVSQPNVEFTVSATNSSKNRLEVEKLLAANDRFVATHISIGFRHVGAAAASATTAQQVQSKVYHSVPASVFAGSGQAAALAGIYNGTVSVKTNTKTNIPSLPAYVFERIATSQQGIAGAAAERAGGISDFFAIDPITFSGTDKFAVKADWFEGMTFNVASEAVYLVLQVHGFLLSNEN